MAFTQEDSYLDWGFLQKSCLLFHISMRADYLLYFYPAQLIEFNTGYPFHSTELNYSFLKKSTISLGNNILLTIVITTTSLEYRLSRVNCVTKARFLILLSIASEVEYFPSTYTCRMYLKCLSILLQIYYIPLV